MKHLILFGIPAIVLAGCTTVETAPPVTHTTVTREVVTTSAPTTREVIVAEAPPAAIIETRGAQPGPEYVYQKGHYSWSGTKYVWIRGNWVRRPVGMSIWVEGHWEARPGGHVYVPGHWSF
ncbi:MAG: hypothetical protein M3O82_01955 [Verrucomicrobiota bacterium]|nr:hypothetical protein [Verrucomicrobiota bacterium]